MFIIISYRRYPTEGSVWSGGSGARSKIKVQGQIQGRTRVVSFPDLRLAFQARILRKNSPSKSGNVRCRVVADWFDQVLWSRKRKYIILAYQVIADFKPIKCWQIMFICCYFNNYVIGFYIKQLIVVWSSKISLKSVIFNFQFLIGL